MRRIGWPGVFLLIFFGLAPSFAGTREEAPDREMLRLMELLRELEIIRNLDFMRQMNNLPAAEESPKGQGQQKSPLAKKDQPK